MPLYEYECTKCRHRFEVIQKFSDPLEKKCPRCKGSVRKLLSAPAIQFKGSGWYVTDYGRSGNGGRGKKESEGEKKDTEKKADSSSPKKDSKGDKKKDPS